MLSPPVIRHPTSTALDSLAARFNLPNEPDMQDWEYQVAAPERLKEFLDAYDDCSLDEDVRFLLMEIIIRSLEDSSCELQSSQEWIRLEKNLRGNFNCMPAQSGTGLALRMT